MVGFLSKLVLDLHIIISLLEWNQLNKGVIEMNQVQGVKVNKNFNLSVGSEVELSNNFGGRDGFYVIPTLALKWTLN